MRGLIISYQITLNLLTDDPHILVSRGGGVKDLQGTQREPLSLSSAEVCAQLPDGHLHELGARVGEVRL